ncbi:MAG TPA: hypothetical protein VF629_02125 [Hymenobacter sp.]|uniref:hypothetical protein n=1 Tax=Hymenobacter sp. TaxID=1898978 RepID=UPI002ED89305
MQPTPTPSQPPKVQKLLPLIPAFFVFLGVLKGFRHDYYNAGIWVALGLAMGALAVPPQYKKGAMWTAVALVIVALALVRLKALATREAQVEREATQVPAR